ncbi:MAG: hypothetical protein JW787_01595 [Sedimentisphaerales bacterium]|nr:hypothetical protein [Sedimentisphaerales bacterium]
MEFKIGIFLLLPLIIGVIVFIILLIKLLSKNPKLAMLLFLAPLVLFLLAVLWNIGIPVTSHTNTAVVYPRYPNGPSPIWSEGIENEFEADVYPSKISAIHALGKLIVKKLPDIIEEANNIQEITVFSNSQDLELVNELRDTIADLYSSVKCRMDSYRSPTLVNGAIGVYFYIDRKTIGNYSTNPQSGIIKANIIAKEQPQTSLSVDYIDKSWVENFASFVNSRPAWHYRIAKSNETCLTHGEANQQAMDDACSLVGPLINNARDTVKLNYNHLVESGVVTDQFVQSFELSTGKVWRQAILLDVSGQKLVMLKNIISNASRSWSMGWAKTILSILGLFVLITIVYIFLNAATRGYYSLTLKIAGIILAVIFLFIILRFAGVGLGNSGM